MDFGKLLPFVKGVMFMGTPHRGSDAAYWGRILGRLANIPFVAGIRNVLLRDLAPKSTVLGNICEQFVERAMPLQIITVYERVKMRGFNDLVRIYACPQKKRPLTNVLEDCRQRLCCLASPERIADPDRSRPHGNVQVPHEQQHHIRGHI
jgi:hypothetical protein